LFRLVERAVRQACAAVGFKEGRMQELFDEYRRHVMATAEWSDVYALLFQFFRHARPEHAGDRARWFQATEAAAWLAGDEIDADAAKALGLKVEGSAAPMLRDNQEIEQVLRALAQLALASKQPLILCIDQVENLDPEEMKPLARFLHALLDHTANLLLITSGVQQTLLGYKENGVIAEAAWDRIAQYSVQVKRVRPPEARKILEARLERFQEPFLALAEVRRRVQEDSLFPLSRAWLGKQIGTGLELRPRDVLTWARDAWEDHQKILRELGGEVWLERWPHVEPPLPPDSRTPEPIESLIDDVVERKMAEQTALHRLQAGSLPPDAGNLAGLVESLLAHCRGDDLPYTFRSVERPPKRSGRLPPYDLLVRENRPPDSRPVTTGVAFVTNVGTSASAALRRLLQDDAPPHHRMLVTDQERRPLKVGEKGVEYYQDLVKLGTQEFEHVKLDFESYAYLDALREAIGLARSGDLEIEAPRGTIRPVTEAEVAASHHRKDRFRAHALLRPLLTEEPPRDEESTCARVTLDERDLRQFVMAQLAWQMGSTALALTKGYVEIMPALGVPAETAWPRVKAIAEQMHKEGLIHAQPLDNDLYLLLRK
jgi:hypothetical protein